jgi:hypothetical protein
VRKSRRSEEGFRFPESGLHATGTELFGFGWEARVNIGQLIYTTYGQFTRDFNPELEAAANDRENRKPGRSGDPDGDGSYRTSNYKRVIPKQVRGAAYQKSVSAFRAFQV